MVWGWRDLVMEILSPQISFWSLHKVRLGGLPENERGKTRKRLTALSERPFGEGRRGEAKRGESWEG